MNRTTVMRNLMMTPMSVMLRPRAPKSMRIAVISKTMDPQKIRSYFSFIAVCKYLRSTSSSWNFIVILCMSSSFEDRRGAFSTGLGLVSRGALPMLDLSTGSVLSDDTDSLSSSQFSTLSYPNEKLFWYCPLYPRLFIVLLLFNQA